MKQFINTIIRYWNFVTKLIIRVLLHIFYIFPVDKKKIVFSTFGGKRYACNPKYLYLYIKEKFGDKYKYVWIFQSPKKQELVPGASCATNKLTKAYAFLTCKYIISNNDIFWFLPLRKSQVVVQTWHGGGAYKKVGSFENWNRVFMYCQKQGSKNISYYISSSRKFTEVQSPSKWVPEEKFINTGMPRNELFFYSDKIAALKNKVAGYYNIPADRKILMYAPTFRGEPKLKDAKEKIKYGSFDYKKTIEDMAKRFGGNWILLYRGHHLDAAVARALPDSVVDATKYEDMQELLCAADVLITDFSSSMWDFGLIGRPCFLYAPDLQQYLASRGFYTDPFSWPFPMAQSDDELSANILGFDQAAYEKALAKHYTDFGSYENKDACAKVCDAIGIK